MTRLILAAGVAALAITTPAASAPGDRGGGKDRAAAAKQDRAKAQKARGSGNKARTAANQRSQKADRPQARQRATAQRNEARQRAQSRNEARADRQRTQSRNEARQRAQSRNEARADRQRVQARSQASERVQAQSRQRSQAQARAERQRVDARQRTELRADQRIRDRSEQRAQQRAAIQNERAVIRAERRLGRNDNPIVAAREPNVIRVRGIDGELRPRLVRDVVGYGAGGCPPGLAKKPIACMPPGQAKKLVGEPFRVVSRTVRFDPLPQRLRYVYRDTDDYYYRYASGYAYRINRRNDLISALLPLFGLGLTVGQPFPATYSNHYMPTGLRSFYPDTPYTSYRYANGYVYQIDPVTGLIANVDPMLGYGYGYGQMLPVSYSAYNVPYQYRSLYYDTPDNYYRYAPGAIYQVDPTTSLITAVASLLAPGMTVGQPLPMGYSTYNVPMAYRSSYYDTPDAWYRYNNGSIYRVDPATQLVTALVAAVLT
jgi:hypothetical protein